MKADIFFIMMKAGSTTTVMRKAQNMDTAGEIIVTGLMDTWAGSTTETATGGKGKY